MSDFLSENSIPRHLLLLGGIAITSSLLAAVHPWIAACGSFLIMTIAVGIVALHGNRQVSALIVGVAAALSTGVCWYSGSGLSLALVLFVSVLGTFTLSLLGTIIYTTSQQRREKIRELEAQQFELVRKVYNSERSSSLSCEIPVFGANAAATAPHQSADKHDSSFGS